MKKEHVLGLILLALIVLASLSFFVSAETVGEKIWSNLPGVEDANMTRLSEFMKSDSFLWFLVFMLVALVIYSISPFMPFISDNKYVTWAVTLIVAYLSTFSLKSEEIKTVLLSYSALGIIITAVIPFFAIAAIAKKSRDRGHIFFEKALWIAFFAVLFFKWWVADETELGYGLYAFPIIMGLVALLFIWENKIWYLMFKQQLRGYREQFRQDSLAAVTSELERLRDQILATNDDAIKQNLVGQFNKKAKKQRELGGNWRDWGS